MLYKADGNITAIVKQAAPSPKPVGNFQSFCFCANNVATAVIPPKTKLVTPELKIARFRSVFLSIGFS